MGWDNLPIRAEKSLYDLAEFCRERAALSRYVIETPSSTLAAELCGDAVPAGIDPGDWQELRQRSFAHVEVESGDEATLI
jgi:pyruvate,water dikinase